MSAGDGHSSPWRPVWDTPKKKNIPQNEASSYPSTPTPLTPRAIPIPSDLSFPTANRVSTSMIHHAAQSPFNLWAGSAASTTPWLASAPSLESPAYHLYTPISQQGPLPLEFMGAATSHDAESAAQDQAVDSPASGLKFGEEFTPAPKRRKTLAQLQVGRRSIATKRHHTPPFPEFKAKNNVFPVQPRTRAGMSRTKAIPARLPVRVWKREIEDKPTPALAVPWPVTPGASMTSSPTRLKTKPEDTRVAALDSVAGASPLVRGSRLKVSKSMPAIKTSAKWGLASMSGTPTVSSIKAKRSAPTGNLETKGGAATKKSRVAPPSQELPQGGP